MKKNSVSYEVEVAGSHIKLKQIVNGKAIHETDFRCDTGAYSQKVMLRGAYLLAAYRFLYYAAAVMPENDFMGVAKEDMLREWKYLKECVDEEFNNDEIDEEDDINDGNENN